jgi:hypothetical protein
MQVGLGSIRFTVGQKIIFKLEEEGNAALLLHLPKVFAENCFFGSALGLGCGLVVAFPQAESLKQTKLCFFPNQR